MSKPPVRQYTHFSDPEPSFLAMAIIVASVVIVLIAIFYLLGEYT